MSMIRNASEVPGSDAPWLVRAFVPVILAIVFLKLVLAYLVPLTGDEAYFDLWARNPAFGYYDHPPMVGWWLIAIQGVPPLALRMPAVLVSLLPGLIVLWLFGRTDPVRARLAALIALCMPLFMFGIGISTDTPLVLFGICALAFCQKGIETGRAGYFLLGGIALGLAFLSKYFAVLLGLGIAIHILLMLRPISPTALRALLLIAIGVLPAVVLNLSWNACNCWYNIQFNLVSRTGSVSLGLEGTATYLLMLTYVLTPWVLWAFWRHRAEFRKSTATPRTELWIVASLSGLALLGLVSLFRGIGLHWLAVFLPGVMLALPRLPTATLGRLAWASLGFAALQGMVLAAILALPLERLANLAGRSGDMSSVEFYRFPDRLAERVSRVAASRPMFTESYSRSSVLTYYTGEVVGVFGRGSRYGRQFDMITDFRELNGDDLGVVLFDANRARIYADFFDSYELQALGSPEYGPWLLEGQGFRFDRYREDVLSQVVESYYRLPAMLSSVGRCAFLERYELSRPTGE